MPIPARRPPPAGSPSTSAALAANWQDLAARAGEAATAAVVKGDAYGIGIEPAARALAEAGCHTFFVALPEEGLRRSRGGVRDAAIYVLGGLIPGAGDVYAAADLRPGPRFAAGDRGMGGDHGAEACRPAPRSTSTPA